MAQSVITSTKFERKKAMAEPASIPVEMTIPLEEWIHDQAPPHVLCFQGPPGSPQWVGLTSGGCWHDCIVFLL